MGYYSFQSLAVATLFFALAPLSMGAFGVTKVTRMTLYVREVSYGPNATMVVVARPNNSKNDDNAFGTIKVFDNEVWEGGPGVKLVGRSQGQRARASLMESAEILGANIVFVAGKYKGSSLAAVSRANVARNRFATNIVAGTGEFLLARGRMDVEKLDSPPNVLLLMINLTIIHKY